MLIEILMYTCITRMFTCKGCIDCSYASQVCYSLFKSYTKPITPMQFCSK